MLQSTNKTQNGGYINPPRIKRQFRDPYGDWTHKQERRNFGEPVHEDEDEMGVFSLEEYTVMSGKMGVAMWTFFLGCVGALSFGVYATYPDRPSAPRTFEGGLEAELGGPGAPRVRLLNPLALTFANIPRLSRKVTKSLAWNCATPKEIRGAMILLCTALESTSRGHVLRCVYMHIRFCSVYPGTCYVSTYIVLGRQCPSIVLEESC